MKTHSFDSIALILVVIAGMAYITACGWSGAAEIPVSPTEVPPAAPTYTAQPTEMAVPIPTEIPTPTNKPLSLNFKPALTAADCSMAGLPETACTGVAANQQWTPVIEVFDWGEMVLVPAGCFMMGDDQGFPEEQPEHEVCITQPFWIDRTEVTVSRFAEFLNAQPGGVASYDAWLIIWNQVSLIHEQLEQKDGVWAPVIGQARLPIENVMWVGATDFCGWGGGRLPTEAEWEYAARGPNSYRYPWGNELDTTKIVMIGKKNNPAGSILEGASWVGALDLGGSLFEWTSSLYLPYPYNLDDGREASLEENPEGIRVFKGSAWYHAAGMDFVQSSARFEGPPRFANWYHSFRCARPVE